MLCTKFGGNRIEIETFTVTEISKARLIESYCTLLFIQPFVVVFLKCPLGMPMGPI